MTNKRKAVFKMRKKIIAGNWKMNMTPKQAVDLVELLKTEVDTDEVDVAFCVPAVDLIPVGEALKGTNIALGAQNMYFEEKGAFTGEISPEMLTECGVTYVILGHSERRQYFGETDEMVNRKVKKALEHGLIPIICVGETLTQREEGITVEHIRIQVKKALLGLTAAQVAGLVIAYEPIWAIGTGKTATDDQAQEICAAIRQVVREVFGDAAADQVRIQYGGSVNAKNAASLLAKADIDGGLVGGASLKAEFGQIVKYKVSK